MNLFETIAEDMVAAPVRPATMSPEQELVAVRDQLAQLKDRHDALISHSSIRAPDFDERKNQFINDVGDMWSELVGREWELMKITGEAGGRTSLKEFFSK